MTSSAAGADKIKANSAIIDGEAVVHGSGGLPDFQQLRPELGPKQSERLRYHAFDLLYLDGYDLRHIQTNGSAPSTRHLKCLCFRFAAASWSPP